MNPLPPQAYTKETLTKAFAWLQTQSEHIKELATTPDILISLYQKAKMNGDSSLDRPSIQNFKTELKNLAGMMGEFESQPPLGASRSSVKMTPPSALGPTTTRVMEPPQPESLQQTLTELDYRSLTCLREIKNELNLGSDQEALRLLIAVGFKKLKTL